MNKNNVLIIFGGKSNEYEVSLKSASAVIDNIDKDKYNIMTIGITKEGKWLRYEGSTNNIRNNTWYKHVSCKEAFLSPCQSHKGFIEIENNKANIVPVDVIFPVLHGKYAEDGTLQGLLELSEIPFVGCKTLSSAICMDKAIAHTLVAKEGIKVAKSITLYDKEDAINMLNEKAMKLPMYVKPAKSGSSIGITRISSFEELDYAIDEALLQDDKVVIEEAIDGFEVGCAILGKDELIVGGVDEIELSRGFFDFNEKYTLETSRIHTPARITDFKAEEIKEIATKIYKALSCEGLARVDMFIDKKGDVFFNEVNTIPGFTDSSRYPRMMDLIGLSYTKLIDKLIEVTLSEVLVLEEA
ncbi:D-alanine--D-serine ligase VanG [Romboutsia weinsteinii]|uniref:D-alanine--D-alanine ligase n=1 Tax=Romboutsia weinsteinii TaxID=2020949 RepID=A0A371J4V6_9FIRM|nr:D-alanine--D-serine ligase VanG [Romboutsia weinsteinii]RDY27724.1 D-alanine--D-serine ligase VanG [Romboutsia weinsteinii]